MIGAIVGDIIGSRFEGQDKNPINQNFALFPERCYFTDDTVLTVAVAETLMTDGDFSSLYRKWYNKYPHAGYGSSFRAWADNNTSGPYRSWGNGSAMRVSPIAWFAKDCKQVEELAIKSAEVTHNHEDGIKGAVTTAITIWMAKNGHNKDDIREYVLKQGYEFPNPLDYPIDFDVSCQGTVPQAIQCFLDTNSFEEAIRLAVMSGGDSDTMASIAGAIAEAYYGKIPNDILLETFKRLPPLLEIITSEFVKKYIDGSFTSPCGFSDEAAIQELFRRM